LTTLTGVGQHHSRRHFAVFDYYGIFMVNVGGSLKKLDQK